MRKNLVFTPLMVLLAAGGPVNSLSAQDLTSAVMAGRVTSQDGRGLRGVRVIVNSPALLGPRETTTDASGNFRLPILPSGAATVTYVLDGYITRRLTVNLIAGQVSNSNASMTPINMQEETVEIIGTTAQVDKTDTVVQVSFTNEKMNELLKPGDMGSAHVVVPGFAGNLYQRPMIRGGSNRSTKVLYNGITATELFAGQMQSAGGQDNLFMQDMIESFAVLLSPSNARYGNSDGGLVSMVSKKGSNEFKGILRVANLRRNFWNVSNAAYPGRDGTWSGASTPPAPGTPNDNLNKRFEFTLEGPLWKDRLTFAYGGSMVPRTYSDNFMARGQKWGTTVLETRLVGTFFQNDYGDIIRRSELRLYGPEHVNVPLVDWEESNHNQFNFFGQITPNHQVEYSYKESYLKRWGWTTASWSFLGDRGADGRLDQLIEPIKTWSIGYKGIIGNSGVLDARYGKNSIFTELGNAAGTRIVLHQLPSYVPYTDRNMSSSNYANDAGDYGNFDNYLVNGWVQAAYRNGVGDGSYPFMGASNDTRDGGVTTSITLNYQHHLNAKGSHIIDVGYQSDKLDWQTKIYDTARYVFDIPGQLPINLSDRDIYRNPANLTPITDTPGGRLPAGRMAGQYIVWNVQRATLGSIDPYGLQWAIANRGTNLVTGTIPTGDMPLWPVPPNAGQLSSYYPALTERYGNESGKYYTQTQSFYINDMWTLNDHHSVMLGVRLDMFKVWDDVKDVASYASPTFRFAYKWDIYGDQSQLVDVSLNQYNNMVNASTFMPFVEAKMLNRKRSYWNAGPADGKPYLVGIEDILDRSNYGLQVFDELAGSAGAMIDPDWRAPQSMEFSVSFARNFSGGGMFKITYVQREWSNLYDIFPGNIVQMPSGQNQMVRVLKNSDIFKRSYKGVEVEWNIPLTRRLEFGGNYTHARLTHNQTDIGTTEADLRTTYAGASYQMPEYWNQWWPMETWLPVKFRNSEHMFNWWFIYDLTSGKTQSTIALRGRYDTNGYGYRQIANVAGRPVIDGIYDYNGNLNTSGLNTGYWIDYGKSKSDGDWNTTLRYNLTLPLYRKLSWFLTAEISDPFNHRKRSPSGIAGFSMPTNIVLRDYVEPDGTRRVQNLDPYGGKVYNTGADMWSAYTGRGGGRSITLQTGLRF